jgi:hopanoid-associated phosphorylase
VIRLGVVTGLASEAACLSGIANDERPPIRCAGADALRARRFAEALVREDGCGALLSFGLAGGLAPGLAAGALVIADAVIAPDGRRLPTDAGWREGLLARLRGGPRTAIGAVLGRDSALTARTAKRDAFRRTGAVAADMESHGVAEAAARSGVPFLALRAVADPESRRIPGWVAGSIAADGTVAYARVVVGLVLRLWDAPALIGLAADSEQALASLSRAALLAGPAFGLAR